MSNIIQSLRRSAMTAAASCLLASTWVAPLAGAECPTRESRCGKDWAFCPDLPSLAAIVGDGCASIESSCPKPAYCEPDPKKSCGEHWTEWRGLGEAAGDACPEGCVPTEKVGHDSRTVNAFFQMQYRERWTCAGAPLSKKKEAHR